MLITTGMARHSFARRLLEELYFSGTHHARYIEPDVPLHVIASVFQERHMLRPCAELNSIIVGVVGRARQLYPGVKLYAMAFLSNHAHFMLQGTAAQVPPFIGFIKREISRRWGKHRDVRWSGTMWRRYEYSALPTAESQERCLKYILSQGTKEGLVARPQDWPGVHCARPLLEEKPLVGHWLDATAYSRAVDAERRKRRPKTVRRGPFRRRHEVRFDPVPSLEQLDRAGRQRVLHGMVAEIEAEARVAFAGRAPLGAKRVKQVPLDRRTVRPTQPWLAPRRRLICWSSPTDPATVAYVARYWEFQRRFRAASESESDVEFPFNAHVPGRLNLPPVAA